MLGPSLSARARTQVTSLDEWLALYDSPLEFDPSAETVLPLPARAAY
jgi:hypothetical protein